MIKFRRTIAVLMVLVILISAMLPAAVLAENLRYGSRGDKVKELQQKLKRWGYWGCCVKPQ